MHSLATKMPKSRRDRKITTAKTQKKVGLETKQGLVDKIRAAADDHDNLFLFRVQNMRNQPLKELRESWTRSKFFLGKNRVMAIALGKAPEEEYLDNLSQVSKALRNQCGLLFTNESVEKVTEFFLTYGKEDYARTGGLATERVVLEEGPLEQFPHSLEPQLRALGMPTSLKKGVVTLLQDYVVCNEGDCLTSEQARILKLLGQQQAEFK